MSEHGTYCVPHHSALPIINAIGLFFVGLGSVEIINTPSLGLILLGIGAIILGINLTVWFRTVIHESRSGLHDAQMNRTYAWGMFWLLFAQGFLALVFLGTLFYIRWVTLPSLSSFSSSGSSLTHLLLWPNFQATWPPLNNPAPNEFANPLGISSAWGIPLLITLIILSSSILMYSAVRSLKRDALQGFTVKLGVMVTLTLAFLGLYTWDILHIVKFHQLTLGSGIYASLFFMLHLTFVLNLLVSFIFLIVVFIRSLRHHFNSKNSFSVHALSSLWYFVTVLWVLIFISVYI